MFQACHQVNAVRFEFTFEDQGIIKRGSGIACKDANKNWRMLGSEML